MVSKRLANTKTDYLGHKRTNKDGKGQVRAIKD